MLKKFQSVFEVFYVLEVKKIMKIQINYSNTFKNINFDYFQLH